MTFDTLEPFKNKKLLMELLNELKNYEYKLYGKAPIEFYRGKPTIYEFDLDMGVFHFTEKDFKGMSRIFSKLNKKWKTKMTFCVYPAKSKRAIIINIRGSSKAPVEME